MSMILETKLRFSFNLYSDLWRKELCFAPLPIQSYHSIMLRQVPLQFCGLKARAVTYISLYTGH